MVSDWVQIFWKELKNVFKKTILIQPHQDNYCVVWAPYASYNNKANIEAQEGPLHAFSKCAWGLSQDSYWNRLKVFNLQYIQRRVERYRCLYIWKMLNGIVPDCGLSKLSNTRNTRNSVNLVPISLDGHSKAFKSKQRDSLLHAGVKLYNALPLAVRNLIIQQ